MIVRAELRHVLATFVVVSLFCATGRLVEFRGDKSIVRASALEKEASIDLKFLKAPIAEQKVNNFVNSVRLELRNVKTPAALNERDAYVKELVQVLDRFAVNDVMRASADQRTLWLSDRTAARVVRLLGDLNAVEAVETICEHLRLPPDIEALRLTAGEEWPSIWVLFQIGDASLPALQKKMMSDSTMVRATAARTAALILGPRAHVELEKWIAAAETQESRDRLGQARVLFQTIGHNVNTRNLATEEYRRLTLADCRRLLDVLLDRPTSIEIEEDEMKREAGKQARRELP